MTRLDDSVRMTGAYAKAAVPTQSEPTLGASSAPLARTTSGATPGPVVPIGVSGLAPRQAPARVAMAGAFQPVRSAPLSTQRELAGRAWLEEFMHDNAAMLAQVKQPGLAETALVTRAGTQRGVPRDLTAFANRHDAATLRSLVASCVEGDPKDRDAVVDGILRGLQTVVVNHVAREPMREALVEMLTQRNEALEAIANGADPAAVRGNERGPGAAPWNAASARAQLKANDALIHDWSTSLYSRSIAAVNVYALAPDLARASLGTSAIGLDARAFPFDGVEAKTFAQAAVLGELRGARDADATTKSLVESAAQATRRTAKDLLNVLPRSFERSF